MNIDDFSYNLPEKLIAKHPPKERGTSRLLVVNKLTGDITHAHYADLPDFLDSGDLVIRNNTKVIKARLHCKNKEGASREILLLENHALQTPHKKKVLYKGKIRPDETLAIGPHKIYIESVESGGTATVSSDDSLLSIAETYGEVPLPPYMHRTATEEDTKRYQTVFADKAGSVAAPTASLNFTQELENSLQKKSVNIEELTLHVGLGTFLPIRTNDLKKHKMHSEYFVVPKSTMSAISSVKPRENRVLAIGTTVTRTLEYCADEISQNTEHTISGEADIFIYPGYEFKMVDALLTNFHAPRSTVLMMAAAFAGWENLRRAYNEAIKENYAFLSYGDSMLII